MSQKKISRRKYIAAAGAVAAAAAIGGATYYLTRPPAPTPTPTPKEVTLRILTSLTDEPTKRWNAMISEEYKKENPNVTVQWEYIPSAQLYPKVQAAILSGKGVPDAFRILDSPVGLLEALEPLPEDLAERVRSEVIREEALRASTYQGKVMFLPWSIQGSAAFWNKELYEQAGLTRPPRNWDELVEFSIATTQRDEKGKMLVAGCQVRYSGFGQGIFSKWASFAYQNGGEIMMYDEKEQRWKITIDSPECIEALQFYADWVHKWKFAEIDFGDNTKTFQAGKNAYLWQREGWLVKSLKENFPNIKFGTAEAVEGERKGVSIYLVSWGVPKLAPHKKEMFEFLDWLFDRRRHESWCDMTGWSQQLFKGEKLYPADPLYEPFAKSLEYGRIHFLGSDVWDVIGDAIVEVLYGRKTAKEAFTEAANKANKLLTSPFYEVLRP